MNARRRPVDRPAGEPASAASSVLEFDQVTFGYQRLPVLREASLRILAGEFVAMVGPNGAGKTTCIRLALGLLQPSHGTVRLFGSPVEAFGDWGRVGYVPQRAAADAEVPISVEEVVRSGLAGNLGLLRRPSRAQREHVVELLDLLGLRALRAESVTHLSGGQQQRALIARALVTDPDLLVLDEPTSGIDVDARGVLRESLEHLCRSRGVAVVYVSHDPEGFGDLADRVLEVRAGRVAECEDPSAHTHAHRGAPPSQGRGQERW